MWGEQVAAVIVLKENTTLTIEELVAYSKIHLADYKCPKIVKFVKEFPRTATGKIQKTKVQDELISTHLPTLTSIPTSTSTPASNNSNNNTTTSATNTNVSISPKSKQPESWTVEEVKQWLSQVGLGQYGATFETHRIDGRALTEIAHNIRDILFLEMVEKRLGFHLFGDLMGFAHAVRKFAK